MVSAIGNMISMYRHLQAGHSIRDLIIRQIMGGVLLLIFAMISESIFGIHGAVANLMKTLDDPSAWNWQVILYRGYHFETIHTIAWCIILNGIIQGILSKNDGWKNPSKLIRIYIILALIVIVLTPLLWWLVDVAIPGYPWAIDPNTEQAVQYPVLGRSPWWQFITHFFLNAIAGREEPIFPYLAASFIGSIVGIQLSRNREDVPQDFPKKVMKIGFIVFAIGIIGLLANLIVIMDTSGMDAMMETYIGIPFHRNWVPNHPNNPVPFLGWLFQFMALNGTAICLIMVVVRLVEFRGRGQQFADKTRFIRRFGFIAFTLYNIQWLYFVSHYIISTIIYGEPYKLLDWSGTFMTMGLTFLMLEVIMLLWERVKYTGSLEWCMGTIAAQIIPARKSEQKWWQAGQLNVEGAFCYAEWLNIVENYEIAHEELKDSKLAFKLSFFGFLFAPLSFITFFIARGSKEKEPENKYNKRATIISSISIIFFILWLVLLLLFSMSDLGISL